jgi:colanic acid/amylovoran biosynthesis protein
LAGFDDQSDGGSTLDTPLKVIQQAGRCRVVVTGAYHAAVFALAQGIPVVALANAPYYVSKFLGLEDQFGLGCETVFLSDPNLLEKLRTALERTWQSAEMVRLPLQNAAFRQIQSSWGAYYRVKDIIASH